MLLRIDNYRGCLVNGIHWKPWLDEYDNLVIVNNQMDSNELCTNIKTGILLPSFGQTYGPNHFRTNSVHIAYFWAKMLPTSKCHLMESWRFVFFVTFIVSNRNFSLTIWVLLHCPASPCLVSTGIEIVARNYLTLFFCSNKQSRDGV